MKNSMFIKQMSRFSQKLMLTALASTVIVAPAVSVSIPVMAATSSTTTSSVTITSSEGYLESAAVTWAPVANATGYNVYYKSAYSNSYKQLD